MVNRRLGDCGLRIADCGLRIADCGLRIADFRLAAERPLRADDRHGEHRRHRAAEAHQPVTRKAKSSFASPSWSPTRISTTYSPGGSAASGRSICCSPGRRRRFDLQVVHRRSGAVQEARAKRRHRAARAVGRHADQQMLDAIELAPGERDDVGGRPKLLKVAGGPRAEHRGRAHQRLRGGQIRDDDLAGLGVEHLRVGPFDREAQLHLAGVDVEGHALRRLAAWPRPQRRPSPAGASRGGDRRRRRRHAASEVRRAVGADRRQRHARRLFARPIARRLRQRLPDEGHARLAVLAARGPDPGADDARARRPRDGRGERRFDRLGRPRLRRRERARRVLLRERPVALPRADLHAGPLHAHADVVELAVGRRLRRVVADQVVGARVARDLLHADGEIVAIDDRAAVGVLRQHAAACPSSNSGTS